MIVLIIKNRNKVKRISETNKFFFIHLDVTQNASTPYNIQSIDPPTAQASSRSPRM